MTTKNNGRLEIYPNPASGSFTMKIYADKDDDVTVKIINSSGNIVKELTNIGINPGENLIQIDDLALETGIYLVSVEGGNKITGSEKVLIYDE